MPRNIVRDSGQALLVIIVVIALFIGLSIGISEAKQAIRMAQVPQEEKTALENGALVAERFRAWITEHRAYPESDSLIQAIAFGPGSVPNVLQNGRPVRFCYQTSGAEPGDLVLVGGGWDPSEHDGPPFTFQCETHSLCSVYNIHRDQPEKVDSYHYFR